jgi:hypothetical protein
MTRDELNRKCVKHLSLSYNLSMAEAEARFRRMRSGLKVKTRNEVKRLLDKR